MGTTTSEMDYLSSAMTKAGELAGQASTAAGAFAEEHDLAGKYENAKAVTKEKYAEKLGRDMDEDIAVAGEKAAAAAATASAAAKVAGTVITAKAAEMDEKHGISTKFSQGADSAVAMYDEKTGRSYYDDKASTQDSGSEKLSGVGAVLGALGESAAAGYNRTAPSNTTEAIVDADGAPPPAYEEICEMPKWCEPKVFTDCFSGTISSKELLMETCTNLVQRIDLQCDLNQIEAACENCDIAKDNFTSSDALMHWFCGEAQFGKCEQFP